MIPVIIFFQFHQSFFWSNLQLLRQPLHIFFHLRTYFILTNTTDGSIRFIHTNILNIIKFAEYTELGEFGNASQKHISQIRITRFQWTVEVAHDVAQYIKIFPFMRHIQQRSIVFVDKYDHFLTCLLISTLYQPHQTLIGINLLL